MNDQLANTQLELACRLGSEEDIMEALEDGADINFNGSNPLFVAVLAGDRAVLAILVEQGADVAIFGLDAAAEEPEALIDALMQLAPAPVVEEEAAGDEDPVDGKLARLTGGADLGPTEARARIEALARLSGLAFIGAAGGPAVVLFGRSETEQARGTVEIVRTCCVGRQ